MSGDVIRSSGGKNEQNPGGINLLVGNRAVEGQEASQEAQWEKKV